MKTVGIALGGGGAKGLAHIAVLEVLDDLGIRPNRISGTSIGAIMGALYASGIPAKEMREGIGQLTASPKSIKDLVAAKQLPGWMEFISVELGRGSLVCSQYPSWLILLSFPVDDRTRFQSINRASNEIQSALVHRSQAEWHRWCGR